MLPPTVTAGVACCVSGVAVLVAVVVARARAWHRDAPVAAAEDTGVFPASAAYVVGIWCLPTGIGLLSAGVPGGVVLGVAAGAALAFVVVPRSGMRITHDEVYFGTDRVPLDAVATVVRSPKASVGRAFGTWGVADAEGRWIAAFRPHAARNGSGAVRALIARAGLAPAPDGRTWTSADAAVPTQPFPAFAR